MHSQVMELSKSCRHAEGPHLLPTAYSQSTTKAGEERNLHDEVLARFVDVYELGLHSEVSGFGGRE